MIAYRFPYAKYEYSDEWEVSCVTDDWDFGDYDATWHFHFLNIHPEMKVEESP